jgi:hypothetical protein
MSRAEKLAVYADPATLDRVAQLPLRHPTPLLAGSAANTQQQADEAA